MVLETTVGDMASRIGVSFLHGPMLVAAITSVCSSGFLLFGYDQGVMGGVVISDFWLAAMGQPSTLMVGTITALYDVGAVFGAIAAAFTAERMGRKYTLLLGSLIVIIGAIIMGTAFERIQFMVARVITGIGIGYVTSVTPVYQSEISAAAQRGWQVCCQLTTMLFGLMLAYWINYGVYPRKDDFQWRFPVIFQAVFGVYIWAITIWLPDTPRWLMRHDGNEERGLQVLARLRGLSPESETVQSEKDQIMDAIMIEAKEEGTWGDLFRDNGIAANKRFYLSLGIQFMQQMSGKIPSLLLSIVADQHKRNQHRDLLRPDTIPRESGDEPTTVSVSWMLASSILFVRFILDCAFLSPVMTETLLTSFSVVDHRPGRQA